MKFSVLTFVRSTRILHNENHTLIPLRLKKKTINVNEIIKIDFGSALIYKGLQRLSQNVLNVIVYYIFHRVSLNNVRTEVLLNVVLS